MDITEYKINHFTYKIEDLLELFQSEPYVFFLHSSQWVEGRGRYSILGFDPFDVFQSDQPDAIDKLKEKFSLYKDRISPSLVSEKLDLPFFSGIVGHLGYDLGLQLENIPSHVTKDIAIDSCLFGFYDCVLVYDHLMGELWIQSSGLPERQESLQKQRAKERRQRLIKIIQEAEGNGFFKEKKSEHQYFSIDKGQGGAAFSSGIGSDLISNFTKQKYFNAVEKALDYIRAGEIYQVNLSQRFQFDALPKSFDPIKVYQRLSYLSPTSFSAYFDCGSYRIMSSSPERFLKLEGARVETRPMKGTRPRGQDSYTDKCLIEELISSKKEKAELLMITDLLRNDIGRVCEYGTVHVNILRHIERYKTVFQAISLVQGELKREKDAFDLLKACFPGGSITGCPKIRAMEIIDELEPTSRSLYTGSLGYIDFSGNMDFNILIRTLIHYKDSLYFQVGGGIVFDSTPEKEYEETLVKAKAMKHCLESLFQTTRA